MMRERKVSRICLMLVPLLVVCLLVAVCGTSRADGYHWETYLTLTPDQDEGSPYQTCDVYWTSTESDHADAVQTSNDGEYNSTQGTWMEDLTDVYNASVWGTWGSLSGNDYRHACQIMAKHPSIHGVGTVTVEVWKRTSDDDCNGYLDPNLSEIATKVETWERGIADTANWTNIGYTIESMGTDPTSAYGDPILRVIGYEYAPNQNGSTYVDRIYITYSALVPNP